MVNGYSKTHSMQSGIFKIFTCFHFVQQYEHIKRKNQRRVSPLLRHIHRPQRAARNPGCTPRGLGIQGFQLMCATDGSMPLEVLRKQVLSRARPRLLALAIWNDS